MVLSAKMREMSIRSDRETAQMLNHPSCIENYCFLGARIGESAQNGKIQASFFKKQLPILVKIILQVSLQNTQSNAQ